MARPMGTRHPLLCPRLQVTLAEEKAAAALKSSAQCSGTVSPSPVSSDAAKAANEQAPSRQERAPGEGERQAQRAVDAALSQAGLDQAHPSSNPSPKPGIQAGTNEGGQGISEAR